jgi:hypothetical protein
MAQTRLALEDMGEHLSPKKAPAMTAPPVRSGSAPEERARSMRITPMMLEVQRADPVRSDTRQQRRNDHSAKKRGSIQVMARQTM